ncbi:MAG: CRISPR-associated protein Cas5 [Thermoguttaceae bacterium]
MTTKQYPIALEISGPTAMWTRPDTGDAPVSYPAPTFSAAKAIFESILWLKNAEVVPTQVGICSPLIFHTYSTNYGGPLRKARIMKKGSSYQLLATVLINVCYRLFANVQPSQSPDNHLTDEARRYLSQNGGHAYQEIFGRRLQRGQCHALPCLGWKEFVPDYVGPLREQTKVCADMCMVIPSMLSQVFPHGKFSCWQPTFRQNVKITKGVLDYAQ